MQKSVAVLSAMCLALAEALCPNVCAKEAPQPIGNHLDELQTYDRSALRKNRDRMRQELANAQRDKLEMVRDYAVSNSNIALEMNALDKLALVKGRNSMEYLFASLTFKLKQGGKARQEAQSDLDMMCMLSPNSYECVQGKARYELSSPQMKVQLQPFYMHENNSDYAAAVQDIDEIFRDGPPLEHELRFRYFSMMGQIRGRELDAVAGLKTMLAEMPEDNALTRRVKLALNTFHAQGLASQALSDIDDPRKAKRAQADLQRALQLDPQNAEASYWKEILTSSRYYRLVDGGDEALEKRRFADAASAYSQAVAIDPHSPYAYVGLARAYVAQLDEQKFNRAAEAAIVNSKRESPSEQQRIRQTLNAMRGSFVSDRAQKAEQAGRNAEAAQLYAQALNYDPDNPWLYHALAGAKLSVGDRAGALSCFDKVLSKVRKDPEYAFARALILDRADLQDEALAVLKPHVGKDDAIDETYKRLMQERSLAQAQRAYAKEDYALALTLLADTNGPRSEALRADIAYAQGDLQMARDHSLNSLRDDPEQIYMRLRLAQILHDLGDDEGATAQADRLDNDLAELSLENRRALAQLYSDMGNKIKALELYTRSLKVPSPQTTATEASMDTARKGNDLTALAGGAISGKEPEYGPWIRLREYHIKDADFLHRYRLLMSQMSSSEKKLDELVKLQDPTPQPVMRESEQALNEEDRYTRAWIMRNAAQTAQELGQDQDLLQRWREALGEYDGRIDEYDDNGVYTHALLTPDEEEDWLRTSLRVNGEREYLRQTVVLNEGISFIRDSGHPGYSDNRGYVNVLNITFPLLNGTGKFQTDRVMLNAGSLSGGAWEDMYGTIFSTGTDDLREHRKVMNTYAFAFDNETLHVDLGTTPRISSGEIKANGLAGGISYTIDYGDWSFTPEIYRRAKDNSVLTFLGDKDPLTGRKWGAVKRTGIALSGSYYVDELSGWWFTAGFEKLKGTQVEDNSQTRAMGGYYYHLIDHPNERMTLSPSLMYMSYDKDLSGYTLGQGGYYSPQLYLSLGAALRYLRRHENTSYMVELSGSLSHSTTDAIARYPLKDLLPDISDRDAISSGDSNTNFGYGLRGSIEQRVTSRLVVGGVLEGSKSDDYSPLNVMLYLRYYFSDFNGDLLMPPAGPTPFVDW